LVVHENNNSKRLLIDMDSVIVDLMTTWHAMYNRDYDDDLHVGKLLCWDTAKYVKQECGERIYEYLDRPGLFRSLPPIPGAIETLKRLSQVYEIVIVTSSRKEAFRDKEEWVTEHLPFIGPRNLIFAHRKELIMGDLLFDDAPHNLEAFMATGRIAIAMDYPYNRSVNCPRVANWSEFEEWVRTNL
jgi:5'-nucleotidase